jgi:protease YdgD
MLARAAFALAWLTVAGGALADTTGLRRLTTRVDTFGWEAVGRIDVAEGGYCTGTLIAPDLVLTAAHCIFDPVSGTARDPREVRFRAALRDGAMVAEARVARMVAMPGYQPGAPASADNIRLDVALLELADAIPSGVAAPFLIADAAVRGREISVVSYASGRDNALSLQRGCNVLGRQDGLMAFDCDVTFGSSGAPVFDWSAGRARILSIISAGNRSDEGTVAYGMALPDAVSVLKAGLRSGAGVIAPPAEETGAGTAKIGRKLPAAIHGARNSARFVSAPTP